MSDGECNEGSTGGCYVCYWKKINNILAFVDCNNGVTEKTKERIQILSRTNGNHLVGKHMK